MRRWPFQRWRRYRAYYQWWRREEYQLHGWKVASEDEEGDKRRGSFWVEEGQDDPFAGKTWDSESAVVPR